MHSSPPMSSLPGIVTSPQDRPLGDGYLLTETVLGSGRFGIVKVAVHREQKAQVAVKCINRAKFSKKDDDEKLQREIDILKRIRHPGVVQFYEVFQTKTHVYMVMEMVSGGELFDRIVEKDHYSETEAARVFVQMMEAVDYIHSVGVVHRDLKPENILLADPSPDAPVKLADFGLGRILEDPSSHTMKTVCGTPIYVAPEVLVKQGYGQECDVWAAGVILYILLCGFPPFDQELTLPEIFRHIKTASYDFPSPYWDHVSKEAKDLIKNMLKLPVDKRLNCRECLNHPWVKKFNSGDLSRAHMPQTQVQLKEYTVARRFKGAINTFVALTRMRGPSEISVTPKIARQRLSEVEADEERMAELREAFDILDRDHKHQIKVKNLTEVMWIWGRYRSHDEVSRMLDGFDLYHLGHISFEEFCIMMGPRPQGAGSDLTSKELMEVFRTIDQQGKGKVTAKELQEVLSRLGTVMSEVEVQRAMAKFGKKHDGSLDFEDFTQLMKTSIPSWA